MTYSLKGAQSNLSKFSFSFQTNFSFSKIFSLKQILVFRLKDHYSNDVNKKNSVAMSSRFDVQNNSAYYSCLYLTL